MRAVAPSLHMHEFALPEGEEVHKASRAKIIGPDLCSEIYGMLTEGLMNEKAMGIIPEEREGFLKYFDVGGVSTHVPDA